MKTESILEDQLYMIFIDRNPLMVMAWSQSFGIPGKWHIGVGNSLQRGGDAVVSPANSFGFMDGGIDLAYRNYFGLGIQVRVQEVINQKYGEIGIPVGEAFVVSTSSKRIPYMIVAPTMKTPGNISETDNVYRAMRAILETTIVFNHYQIKRSGKKIGEILIPGLGTGIGKMDPFDSAEQMRSAYNDVREELIEHGNNVEYLKNVNEA